MAVKPAHWAYQDPLEAELLPAVSAEELMEHTRAIAAWEREAGSPGEARAFDYIEGCLKRFGLEVERREIEAFISLPLEARILLPDGTAISALTHSFSTSTPPGKAWAAQEAGSVGQVFTNLDHLHNMIVTTVWGTPTPATRERIPGTP